MSVCVGGEVCEHFIVFFTAGVLRGAPGCSGVRGGILRLVRHGSSPMTVQEFDELPVMMSLLVPLCRLISRHPRRQYHRTAIVMWPTSCLHDVLCQRSSPASRGQWGVGLPEGVTQLLRDLAVAHGGSGRALPDPDLLQPGSAGHWVLSSKVLTLIRYCTANNGMLAPPPGWVMPLMRACHRLGSLPLARALLRGWGAVQLKRLGGTITAGAAYPGAYPSLTSLVEAARHTPAMPPLLTPQEQPQRSGGGGGGGDGGDAAGAMELLNLDLWKMLSYHGWCAEGARICRVPACRAPIAEGSPPLSHSIHVCPIRPPLVSQTPRRAAAPSLP